MIPYKLFEDSRYVAQLYADIKNIITTHPHIGRKNMIGMLGNDFITYAKYEKKFNHFIPILSKYFSIGIKSIESIFIINNIMKIKTFEKMIEITSEGKHTETDLSKDNLQEFATKMKENFDSYVTGKELIDLYIHEKLDKIIEKYIEKVLKIELADIEFIEIYEDRMVFKSKNQNMRVIRL